jgi:hypothetical protein
VPRECDADQQWRTDLQMAPPLGSIKSFSIIMIG